MKKEVNGKNVDVGNIELFEKALEGMATVMPVYNSINTKLAKGTKELKGIIKCYKVVYKAMPFPLYAIEEDIKYAVIGNFMQKCLAGSHHIWVDDGLCVGLINKKDLETDGLKVTEMCNKEEKLIIKFRGNTWGIIDVDNFEKDNLNLSLYKDSIGYIEFRWFLDKLLGKKGKADYYDQFMPGFMEACRHNKGTIQQEFKKMLSVMELPPMSKLKYNMVIDTDNNCEYYIDICSAGKQKTGKSEEIWTINEFSVDTRIEEESIQVYRYDTYEKKRGANLILGADNLNRINNKKVVGLNNIFNTLCGIRMSEESSEFHDYSGIIISNRLVYIIDGRVFICSAFETSDTKEVAYGMGFYGYDRAHVFLVENSRVKGGAIKKTIYSLNLFDNKLRLCDVKMEKW